MLSTISVHSSSIRCPTLDFVAIHSFSSFSWLSVSQSVYSPSSFSALLHRIGSLWLALTAYLSSCNHRKIGANTASGDDHELDNSGFGDVSTDVLVDDTRVIVGARSWKDQAPEGVAALGSVRRAARNSHLRKKRFVFVGDNMVLTCALAQGRTTDPKTHLHLFSCRNACHCSRCQVLHQVGALRTQSSRQAISQVYPQTSSRASSSC